MNDNVVLGGPVHKPAPDTYSYPKEMVHAPEHPAAQELIAYWQTCEAKGGMRMGRDVPARPIAKLLRNIAISEPVGDWDDAHIRLAGLAYAERFGRDIAGMNIRALYADDVQSAQALLEGGRHVTATREPRIMHTRVMAEAIELMRYEVVSLPVFAPAGDTIWCLTGAFRF